MDIKIKDNNKSFHYRVRGIIKQDGRFLIMREEGKSYFHMTGGHVEIGESAEQAIKREVKEELGIETEVKNLVCIDEHFYEKSGESIHDLIFYYTLKPKIEMPCEDTVREENDKGKIRKFEIKWVTPEDLIQIDLKPQLVKDLITNGGQDLIHLTHFM